MQFQSYSIGIPGFCTRDFYADVSGNKWPLYDVDKAFSGSHYNNRLLPPPLPDGGNRLNSNAVKQKILEHEAVFRNQVAELHRLYRKQRELMDEVRAEQLYQHRRQLNVPEFKENSFSLINLPTDVQKIPNVSSVQWLNPVPDGTVCCPQTSQSQNLSSISWLNPVPDRTVCFPQTSRSQNISSVQWFTPAPDRTVCCPQTSQSHLTMNTEKNLHTGLTGCSLKSSEIMESKCKKYQKKILDLELPASEYIDSDDGEMVEVETTPDVSNRNTVEISCVLPEDDVNPNDSHGWLKSGQQENAQCQNPSQTRTTCLVDLNEPIQVEEEAFSLCEELTGSFTSNVKIVPHKPSREVCTVLLQNTREGSFELLTPPPSDQDDERSENKVSCSPETSERINDPSEDSIPNGECKMPFSNQAVPSTKVDSSELFLVQPYAMPVYEVKRNPIVVQALPCFNGPVKIRRRSFISSTRSSVSLGDITWLNKKPRCSLYSTRAHSTPSTPCHSSQCGKSIDLNASINWDASPPLPSTPKTSETASEMVLKSPVSPENKEGSPPRGESDESRLEIPLHMLSRVEDGDSLDEGVRLAAKSLVFISSSEIQICTNSDFESCDASPQNSLLWFAGVISLMPHSFEGDIESNLDEMNEEKVSAVGFDYFEAMTLRLAETKVERPNSPESTQGAKEPDSPPAKTQGRRTRPRAGRKWKDFQRDVLPCLASLSRHEVTEDLQLIETLMMEAAGVTSVLGSGRRRNGCSRARRRLCVSRSDVAENPTSPVLKQQQGPGEVSSGDRITVDWGKIRRRRRAPRHAANDFSLLSIQA